MREYSKDYWYIGDSFNVNIIDSHDNAVVLLMLILVLVRHSMFTCFSQSHILKWYNLFVCLCLCQCLYRWQRDPSHSITVWEQQQKDYTISIVWVNVTWNENKDVEKNNVRMVNPLWTCRKEKVVYAFIFYFSLAFQTVTSGYFRV